MRIYEKWYSIEPIKGYVINADFARMKVLLEMELHYNVNFIKKRDFILIIITSKKPISVFGLTIYKILKEGKYKKTYQISALDNERTINHVEVLSKTIGIPY